MLYYHWKKDIPLRPDNIRLRSKKPLHGTSYLLNPEKLFSDKTTDLLFKSQYIKLTARRDYSLYKEYGYKGLHRSFFPDLNIPAIKNNPLLRITDTEILFKYEETIWH